MSFVEQLTWCPKTHKMTSGASTAITGGNMDKQVAVAGNKRRAVYVDRARGAVIAIVLFSHAMNVVEGWATEAPAGVWGVLSLVIRTGTPTFFVVFGIAVEIVHVNRWRNGNANKVRHALLKRALQCYVAFALVAVAGFVGGLSSFTEMLQGLIFVAEVPNGTVLSFYALALLACLALIPLRLRIGTIPTLVLTIVWWPLAAALESVFGNPDDAPFALARVLGVGDGVGPSVAHGLALVAGGMVLGRLVRAMLDGAVTRRIIVEVTSVICVASAATVFLTSRLGPEGVFRGYTDLSEFRQTNHWGYFTIGFLLATGILVAAYLLVEKIGITKQRKPGPFGSSSLLAFGGGNVVLNLFGSSITATSAVQAVAISVAFTVAIWLVIKLDRIRRDAGPGSMLEGRRRLPLRNDARQLSRTSAPSDI